MLKRKGLWPLLLLLQSKTKGGGYLYYLLVLNFVKNQKGHSWRGIER